MYNSLQTDGPVSPGTKCIEFECQTASALERAWIVEVWMTELSLYEMNEKTRSIVRVRRPNNIGVGDCI